MPLGPSSGIGPMENSALQACGGNPDITRRPGRRMAEWPLIDMDLPESVQVAGCLQKKDKHDRSSPPCLLSEPKKSASRTTSIPHLFAYPFENSFSLDHPLAPPVTSS